MKKNRYVVVKLSAGEDYDGSQTGKEFSSKPAAYDYAQLKGYGHVVCKIIRNAEEGK